MAQRFIAGIITSFIFTFGTALFFFQDRNMVLPVAMFTFPTVFLIGIPMSMGIDILMRNIRNYHYIIVFLIEGVLYIFAGYLATLILFGIISGELLRISIKFQVLGVIASCVYYLFLILLRKRVRINQ